MSDYKTIDGKPYFSNDYVLKREQEIDQLRYTVKAIRKCIMDFLLTEEYIKVDGVAIANNYRNLLKILGDDKE